VIYPATIYLGDQKSNRADQDPNLTGYRLSTAYSLGSGLCQDILRMQAVYTKTEAAPKENMKKWIIGYCNDLIHQAAGIGPVVTGAFRSRRTETAFLCLVIYCLSNR